MSDRRLSLYECNVTFYVVAESEDDALGKAESITSEELPADVSIATSINADWSNEYPYFAEPEQAGIDDSCYDLTCSDWLKKG